MEEFCKKPPYTRNLQSLAQNTPDPVITTLQNRSKKAESAEFAKEKEGQRCTEQFLEI